MCVHLCGTAWLLVCGRLFELDPGLLSLFHYTTNCGSTQDCLSSPEFLEHVTKVSPLHSYTPSPPQLHTTTSCTTTTTSCTTVTQLVVCAEHQSVLPGDACDRRCRQPPGRPSLPGGLFAQPGPEASGSGSPTAVVCCMIHIVQLFRHFHIFIYREEKKTVFLSLCACLFWASSDCG